MKSNLQLILLVAFAVATGALGALLTQAKMASAQGPTAPRECVILAGNPGHSHIGNPQHLRYPIGRFAIPQGWRVVGALGGPRNGLYLCR